MVVDGVELLRMIRDRELKEGTKVYYKFGNKMCKYTDGSLILVEDKSKSLLEIIPDCYFARGEFEIISEEEEIDIQAIEELDEDEINPKEFGLNEWSYEAKVIVEQQNKLLHAIKQLDKKIK